VSDSAEPASSCLLCVGCLSWVERHIRVHDRSRCASEEDGEFSIPAHQGRRMPPHLCDPRMSVAHLSLNLFEATATNAIATTHVTTSAPAGNSGAGVVVVVEDDEVADAPVAVEDEAADDPLAANSTILLFPVSLTQMFPDESMATP
jgi:hypothetical protein